jgi:hypothetical protein
VVIFCVVRIFTEDEPNRSVRVSRISSVAVGDGPQHGLHRTGAHGAVVDGKRQNARGLVVGSADTVLVGDCRIPAEFVTIGEPTRDKHPRAIDLVGRDRQSGIDSHRVSAGDIRRAATSGREIA